MVVGGGATTAYKGKEGPTMNKDEGSQILFEPLSDLCDEDLSHFIAPLHEAAYTQLPFSRTVSKSVSRSVLPVSLLQLKSVHKAKE